MHVNAVISHRDGRRRCRRRCRRCGDASCRARSVFVVVVIARHRELIADRVLLAQRSRDGRHASLRSTDVSALLDELDQDRRRRRGGGGGGARRRRGLVGAAGGARVDGRHVVDVLALGSRASSSLALVAVAVLVLVLVSILVLALLGGARWPRCYSSQHHGWMASVGRLMH